MGRKEDGAKTFSSQAETRERLQFIMAVLPFHARFSLAPCQDCTEEKLRVKFHRGWIKAFFFFLWWLDFMKGL